MWKFVLINWLFSKSFRIWVIQNWRHAKRGKEVSKNVIMRDIFLTGGGVILISATSKYDLKIKQIITELETFLKFSTNSRILIIYHISVTFPYSLRVLETHFVWYYRWFSQTIKYCNQLDEKDIMKIKNSINKVVYINRSSTTKKLVLLTFSSVADLGNDL